ncbi:MAG TPA: hypothetical protein VH880_05715 [Anaeromyxobacteraceae bacterium]|jgi:hypothetical protein
MLPRAPLVVAALALVAGCAAPGREARGERWPETPAALAVPEPDPSCRGTVQEALGRGGLQRVVVRLAAGPSGRVEVVSFLSPDVTPAAQAEIRRALATCAWAPRPAPGGAETWITTWVHERGGR